MDRDRAFKATGCFTVDANSLHGVTLRDWCEAGEDLEIIDASITPGPRAPHLVSTSIYNLVGDHVSLRDWSFNSFSRVLGGPPKKYWEPLNARAKTWEGYRLRIYLPHYLVEMVPFLKDLGIHEVLVMAPGPADHRQGSWRYLPLLEDQWESVTCTGIDSYRPIYHSFLIEKTDRFRAVMAPYRAHRIWAGPVKASPAALRSVYEIPEGLGVGHALNALTAQRKGQFKGVWNGRCSDAFTLEMLFHNQTLFELEPQFAAGFHVFAKSQALRVASKFPRVHRI